MQCISGHCYRRSGVVVSVLVTTVIQAKMAETIKMRFFLGGGGRPAWVQETIIKWDPIPLTGRGTLGDVRTLTPLGQLTRPLFAPAGRN